MYMEFQKWNSVYQQLNNSNFEFKTEVIVEMMMAIGQSDTKYFFYLHFSEKKKQARTIKAVLSFVNRPLIVQLFNSIVVMPISRTI